MLVDEIAIVTGAARGLGEGIALEMASQGARVVVADLLEDEGRSVAAKITEEGGRAVFLPCDIADKSSIEACVAETVERFGAPSVLVNNAAMALPPTPITELGDADLLRLLDVNVAGALRCCRSVFPHFLARGGGTVINLSSVHQSHSLDGWTAYAASKGAIIAATRQLASEWGRHGIRVVSISPGAIDATMTRQIFDRDPTGATERRFKMMHALERLGKTEEVAKTVAFLASSGAGFITGEDILVDGGLTKLPRLLE